MGRQDLIQFLIKNNFLFNDDKLSCHCNINDNFISIRIFAFKDVCNIELTNSKFDLKTNLLNINKKEFYTKSFDYTKQYVEKICRKTKINQILK